MKKLLLAIFIVSLSVPGCENRYTGLILTVDNVDRYRHSVGEDTTCLLVGFDAVCVKVIPGVGAQGLQGPRGPQGPQGEPGSPGANVPIIHIHERSIVYEFYYEDKLLLRAKKEMDTTEILAQLTAQEETELQEHLGTILPPDVNTGGGNNNGGIPGTRNNGGNGGNNGGGNNGGNGGNGGGTNGNGNGGNGGTNGGGTNGNGGNGGNGGNNGNGGNGGNGGTNGNGGNGGGTNGNGGNGGTNGGGTDGNGGNGNGGNGGGTNGNGNGDNGGNGGNGGTNGDGNGSNGNGNGGNGGNGGTNGNGGNGNGGNGGGTNGNGNGDNGGNGGNGGTNGEDPPSPGTPGTIDTHRVYPLKDDPNNPGQRVLDQDKAVGWIVWVYYQDPIPTHRGTTIGTSGFGIEIYVDGNRHPDINDDTAVVQTSGTDNQGNPDYSIQFFVSSKMYEGQTPAAKIDIRVTGLLSANLVSTFTLPNTVTPSESTFQDDPLEPGN